MKRYRTRPPQHRTERWHENPWFRRDVTEVAVALVIVAALAVVVGVPLMFVHFASIVARG